MRQPGKSTRRTRKVRTRARCIAFVAYELTQLDVFLRQKQEQEQLLIVLIPVVIFVW